MGTYWYVAVCRRVRLGGASAPTDGGERPGHIVAAARLQLVIMIDVLRIHELRCSSSVL